MPHVLITADTVGGVWTHVRELARGLRRRGWRVTVAVFGPPPSRAASAWAAEPGVEWRYGGPGLEWMPGAEQEVQAAQRWLQVCLASLQPDVLHANQFSAAAAAPGFPVLLAAHSDLVSWWRAVHQRRPPPTASAEFYQRVVQAGLAAAGVVVTPTRAARRDLRESYGPGAWFGRSLVIANGMDPAAWGPPAPRPRQGYAAAAGRIWDAGKQMDLLYQAGLAMPVRLAGPCHEPGAAPAARAPGVLDGRSLPPGVRWAGELDQAGMRALLAGAEVFIVPSRYEPFGLGALEAALSGCALLLNDIPSLREVWGETAAYFRRDQAADLAAQLRALAAAPARRQALAAAARQRARQRYGAQRMADRYITAYRRARACPPAPGSARRRRAAAPDPLLA